MRVLFTCGGTAGHINPALAVAARLKKEDCNCKILFVGAEDRMEMDLVPREGYEIKSVKITNLSRSFSASGISHNLKTLRNVFYSTAEAKDIIRSFKPDAVVGTGGYVCFPVLTAASSLHIPTVIHESNAMPGLTTKLLEKKADRILVGFEHCKEAYKSTDKVIVTGTPVRDGFTGISTETARKKLGVENKPLVLSVWGSLGAEYMNEIILQMIPLLKENQFQFIHVTGKRYYEEFMSRVADIQPDYEKYGLKIVEYLHDMPQVMKASDMIICRAGASTLAELTFIGKPSILIPSPNVTANHQEKNARMLENAGAARVLLEGQFDSEMLYNTILTMVNNREMLSEMSENAASISQADAADRICDVIHSLVRH